MKKIGIMGGSFDPPHIGHLLMAETVKEELELDFVIFIPTGKTGYKNKNTSCENRFNMVSLAIANREGFINSDIEIKRDGYTYTADTLNELNMSYADSQLYFIVGADSLDYMEKWKDPARVFEQCNVVAVNRKGYNDFIMKEKAEELYNKFSADITFVRMPTIDISSTDIRERIKSGKSVRYLVPDAVIEYIRENKLYIGE